MAFAGDIGANALIPFGSLFSRQYGLGVSYDADDNLQFATPGGDVITPARIDELLILGNNGELAALVDNTNDGSVADCGVLVTAAFTPAADESGLPANFGLGRGGWLTDEDLLRVACTLRSVENTVGAVTDTGGPVVRAIRSAGVNDLEIVIKNMSEVALETCTIELTMLHSIQE